MSQSPAPDPSSAEPVAHRPAVDLETRVGPPPVGEHTSHLPPSPAPAGAAAFPFLAPPQAPDELGRLGGYRVLQVLGGGGMGMVLLAEDERLRRPVALKVMRPEFANNSDARARFLREARASAAVDHPNVVPIHAIAEERGVTFLVMPLLRGRSLDAYLRERPQPPLTDVVRIGRELAEGLAAAHDRGLIHRDVKPANVWLDDRDPGSGARHLGLSDGAPTPGPGCPTPPPGARLPLPDPRVKLLDFGLAREHGEESSLTHPGEVIGTPAYMAPEQARGQVVDFRCDLFSLGCVLYQMITARKPFTGRDVLAVLSSLAGDQPPTPAELRPEVPAALSALVMRLLAKAPQDRPGSAREVAEILAAVELDPTLRSPRPAGAPPRPARRRPALVAFLLLSAGSVPAVLLGLDLGFGPGPGGSAESDHTDPLPSAAGPFDRLEPTSVPADLRAELPPEVVAVVGRPRPMHLADDSGRLAVAGVAFAPDGRTLASAGGDGFVRLWDAATLRPRSAWRAHSAEATAVAFSPDGTLLASGGRACDGREGEPAVRLWDLRTDPPRELAALRVPPAGGGPGVVALAFSPDGHTLAAAHADRATLRLWDLAGLRPTARPALRRAGKGDRLAFSADGRWLACDGDGGLKLWELGEGDPRERPVPGAAGAPATAVAFSPDGRALAAHGPGGLQLWDLAGPEPRERFALPARGAINTLAFVSGGRVLAGADADGSLRLWEVGPDGPAERPALKPGPYEPSRGYLDLAAGPGGRWLAAGATDGCIRCWDLAGAEPRELTAPGPAYLAHAGSALAAVEPDGRVGLWDLGGERPERSAVRRTRPGGLNRSFAGRFTPDGRSLLLRAPDGAVHWWDFDRTWRRERAVLTPPSGSPLRGVAVAADGRALAAADEAGALHLWSLTDPEPRPRTIARDVGPRAELAFGPDGRHLAAAGADPQPGSLRLFRLDGPGPAEYRLPATTGALAGRPAFSPDGRLLAVGVVGEGVRLFDLAAVDRPPREIPLGRAAMPDFSPDGNTLLLADVQGRLVAWDLADDQPVRQWQFPVPLAGAWFDDSGRHVLAAGTDGCVFVLRLRAGH